MKCNLIIPGFAKCGTSSLHNYLNQHSKICMSSLKETHYFSREYLNKSEEWHDSLFKDAAKDTIFYGESSTSYSVDEIALDRVLDHIKNVKVIIVMRDPVERLISHYNWMWVQGLEKRAIVDAVKEEIVRGYDVQKDTHGNYYTYYRASNYSHFVPYILESYGEENVLLVRSEEMRENIISVLNSCFSFLDLEVEKFKSVTHANTTEQVAKTQGPQRYLGLESASLLFPQGFKDLVDPKHSIRKFAKSLLGRSVICTPTISEKERLMLVEILQDEIKFYRGIFSL